MLGIERDAEMIRVLFALGSFGGGGAERQTLTWLRHLDRNRFDPALYLISRSGPLETLLPDDVTVIAFEDRHSRRQMYFPGRVRRQQARDLARVATELRVDVLVTVTLHMTMLVARPRHARPWLAVEMADPRRDFFDQVQRFRIIKRRQLAAAYRTAVPLAVSEGVKEGMTAFYGTPSDRINVVPNCVDLDDVDRWTSEPNPNLPEDRYHVVTVGRLQPQKGHRFLLEAVSQLVADGRLSRLHLHLLGEGVLREELEAFVREKELTNHVTFAGYVANPLAYLRRCDLFCLPSIYEGMPLALLEAMACGVPAIASDCESGPRELLLDGKLGTLVPVGEPQPLANAILEAARNPADAVSRALAARRHVEEHYAASAVVKRLERLLEAAVQPS